MKQITLQKEAKNFLGLFILIFAAVFTGWTTHCVLMALDDDPSNGGPR